MREFVEDLILKEECFRIIGICMKVHNKLGRGFKEIVYKNALEVEFIKNKIPYEREKSYKVPYEDVLLRGRFDADFVVYGSIILEIKASARLHYDNFKQILNYLKSSGVKLGILINFGEGRLKYRGVVNANSR